jgi:hypothetical protein
VNDDPIFFFNCDLVSRRQCASNGHAHPLRGS